MTITRAMITGAMTTTKATKISSESDVGSDNNNSSSKHLLQPDSTLAFLQLITTPFWAQS